MIVMTGKFRLLTILISAVIMTMTVLSPGMTAYAASNSDQTAEAETADTPAAAESTASDATAAAPADITFLRDKTAEDFSEDFIMGTSVTGAELNDERLMQLVTDNFNGITLGNELKPDCMFGYHNDICPGTETAELNGEEIEVPKMGYARAEKYLDYILKWNTDHPDRQILVRGHVLVWHSQTPEWFFHEEYDASKPYVSTEEMDKRQEWYIRSVLTHFAGPESEYKDLFYGWDVVNEAISDATGTYRKDTEGSSWWAVYKSEDYIVSAFRYANKYAPAHIRLYYNDYNDCTSAKIKGIEALLTTVKEAPGTRIDGMGMQGHYDINYPAISAFRQAAARYGAIVDEVMLTELDFKASSTYDGTADTLQNEYVKQAVRYRDIYNAMKELNDSGDVKMSGMIVWGVIDGHSWLQAYTGVGGGVTDGRPQCPLLFDDNYEPKPAFYAITDQAKLDIMIEENKKAVKEAKEAKKAAVAAAKAEKETATESASGENTADSDTLDPAAQENGATTEKAPAESAAAVTVTGDQSRGHIAGLIVLAILCAYVIWYGSRHRADR